MEGELNRRAWKAVSYPPLSDLSREARSEFQEALADATSFEDLPGKWQAALVETEANMPDIQPVTAGAGGRAAELQALYTEIHAYAAERDRGETPPAVRRLVPRALESEILLLAQGLAQGTQRVTGYPYRRPDGLSPAGRRLDDFLLPLGYTIDHTDEVRIYAYSTDLIPWFPGKTPDGRHDLQPTAEEVAACWDWFEREAALLEPKVVVLLGHPAARHFLSRYAGLRIGRARPSLQELQQQAHQSSVGAVSDLSAVVVYHPSAAWGSLKERAAESYAAAQPLIRAALGR